DKTAEEKFKEVNNAFDILKDPQKRAAYDRFGDAAFNGGAGGFNGANPFSNGGFNFGGGMEDILREAMRGFGFGGFDGGNSRRGQQKGRDLLDEITIDLKDAFFGKTYTAKYSTNVKCEKCHGNGTFDGKVADACKKCHGTGHIHTYQSFFAVETPCPDCNGTGKKISKKCSDCGGSGVINKQRNLDIKIPAGIEDGARLRVKGMGEEVSAGGIAGDFYLDIHIKPHDTFTRVRDNLVMHKDIDFTTLVLGGTIEINTIDDKKLDVKISAGTQVGEKLRIRGHGMPTGNGSFGDLYIELGVIIPKKLSEKQKKALNEFANLKSDKKSWF
ncbi:MAG: J domain-containing protein, partial [Alphaproteobacteria bacterium]|nr:J domain-containing protein [Alphaproteobacteria bacterium]